METKLLIAFVCLLTGIACAQPTILMHAPSIQTYRNLADEVEKNLIDDDLAKFFPAAVDKRGGFFETFAQDWSQPDASSDQTRSVVYQSRLTWLAAQGAMRYRDKAPMYLKAVRHGAQFLKEKQWDAKQGGFWWSVDISGKPARANDKHLYGNSFALYALTAAYLATYDADDLEMAKTGFAWLEAHAHDTENGGYFEQLHADGSHATANPTPGRNGTDVLGARAGQKTMNAHIHVLEALTSLLEAWPDELLRKRTQEVYDINLTKIYSDPGYLHLYFSADWKPTQAHESYGHDIETAYLLTDAASALGKPNDQACWETAAKIVDHCIEVGFDPQSGSLNNEGTLTGTGSVDRSRVWWIQAESLNALLLMHEHLGKSTPKYWNAFVKQWQFIKTHQIDHQYGGWFSEVGIDNKPSKLAKTDSWTEGYHHGRAMMNVVDRLRKLAS